MKSSTKSHDYDPSWDYDVVDEKNVSRLLLKKVKSAAGEIRKNVIPQLSGFFSDFTIAFINDIPKDSVALYCHGTHSEPCVLIDAINFENIAYDCMDPLFDSFDTKLSEEVLISILHELAHAVQDAQGRANNGWTKRHEQEAEAFAQNYYEKGVINIPNVRTRRIR